MTLLSPKLHPTSFLMFSAPNGDDDDGSVDGGCGGDTSGATNGDGGDTEGGLTPPSSLRSATNGDDGDDGVDRSGPANGDGGDTEGNDPPPSLRNRIPPLC